MALKNLICCNEWISCRRVLDIMVIVGFMFNYMLRVNLTIAIVAMIRNPSNALISSRALQANVSLHADNNLTSSGIHHQEIDANHFAWNEEQRNDILGSFFWGYILTELPGGRLAELVGPRRIFGGSMLLGSLCTLLTPAACYANYYMLLFLRAIVGFSLGATWPAILPLASKWVPVEERSQFTSHMMASALGAAITMPTCGFIIAKWNWPSVFYVTGGLGVLWSLAWFLLIYDSPDSHPRISDTEKQHITEQMLQGQEESTRCMGKVAPTSVPWCSIFTSKPVWAIIITHMCSGFCYLTVINQLPTYMNNVLHFNILNNGWLSSLPYFGKYGMAVAASNLADRLLRNGHLTITATRKIFTSFALFLPAMMMVIQALCGNNATISVGMFTASMLFNGAVTAGYLANGLDIAPNFSGTIFGISNTICSLGGWSSTKLVWLVTRNGHTIHEWQIIFWTLAASYTVGGIVYNFLASAKVQPWNWSAQKDSIDQRSQVTISTLDLSTRSRF